MSLNLSLLIIYLSTFVGGFCLAFVCLLATNLENLFKKGRVFQIKLTYIFISIICGHLFASIFLTISKLVLT